MMRTGIFGGSFNPIHNGHIHLARQLLAAAGLDEIWFVVSPRNPLKSEDTLLDDAMRYEMVSIALENEPQMVASDYEMHTPRPSYMWHTLQSMAADYPDREFILLIGADNWACFDRWFCHEEILRHHAVVIYPRTGSAVNASELPAGVTLADTDTIDISSTEIRRRISIGLPIEHLVPPAVAEMIRLKELYR